LNRGEQQRTQNRNDEQHNEQFEQRKTVAFRIRPAVHKKSVGAVSDRESSLTTPQYISVRNKFGVGDASHKRLFVQSRNRPESGHSRIMRLAAGFRNQAEALVALWPL
jgi:hypothetical protein